MPDLNMCPACQASAQNEIGDLRWPLSVWSRGNRALAPAAFGPLPLGFPLLARAWSGVRAAKDPLGGRAGGSEKICQLRSFGLEDPSCGTSGTGAEAGRMGGSKVA